MIEQEYRTKFVKHSPGKFYFKDDTMMNDATAEETEITKVSVKITP